MKSIATQERSTSPQEAKPLNETLTMEQRKKSAEVINSKPILKKSTHSAAVNTAQFNHLTEDLMNNINYLARIR